MSNGLSRFGLYDLEGNLKAVADPQVTRAGKPAKCMWCHENGIQPMFRKQLDIPGYLTYPSLQDTLTHYGLALEKHQKAYWNDPDLQHQPNHTQMELIYIGFMKPSVTRLVEEWGLSEEEVQQRVGHLPTHRYEEFDFLGDLYHRAAIDSLAPWQVQAIPESIREASDYEPRLLGE